MVVEPDFTHTFKKLAKHAIETNTCRHSIMEWFSYHHIQQASILQAVVSLGYTAK